MDEVRTGNRTRDRWTGALLFVLAAGGAAVLALRRDAPPPRPAEGAVVLDEPVELRGEPVVRRLRVLGPSVLTIDVQGAPSGTSVAFGPAAPIEQGDVSDPAATTRWAPDGAAAHRTLPVYPTGMYVLRLDPPAGSARARLRVTRTEGP
jgi:hypothetical protein